MSEKKKEEKEEKKKEKEKKIDWRKELAEVKTKGSTIKTNKDKKMEIHLDKKVTGKAFKQIIEYLYTDRVNWDKDTDTGLIQETKEAAEYLQIKRLEAICDTYLDKNKNIQVPESEWWNNMKWAFDNLREGKYGISDLTLVCKGGDKPVEVKCHAVILTSACKYFHGMLLGDVENEAKKTMKVTLDDATKKQIQAILKYIYTREFEVSVEDVVGVWILANKFLLEDLQVECESMIQKNIKKENVNDILKIAEMLNSKRIIEICKDFKEEGKK